MGVWTVKYKGVTKTVSDWGLENVKFRIQSQGEVSLTFDVVGDEVFDLDEVFEYDEVLELFFDGTRQFVGRVVKTPRYCGVKRESQSYLVLGPSYDLETTVFRQLYTMISGNQFTPMVWVNNGLGQKAQIEQVLEWARRPVADNGPGLNFEVGTIGVDGWLPKREFESETCMAVIRDQLRMNPDSVQWWGFAGAVPQFNVGRWKDLPAVAVTLGVDVGEPALIDRKDIPVPAVVIIFRRKTITDGDETYTFNTQVWPEGADPNQRGVIPFFFDLAGKETTRVRSLISAEVCLAGAADPTVFFQNFDAIFDRLPALGTKTWYNDLKVVGQDGLPVSLADYPNYLLPDSEPLTTWMEDVHGIRGKKVRITRSAQFEVLVGPVNEAGDEFKWVKRDYTFCVEVVLTNAVSREYVATSSTVAAEPEPEGLARYVYESLEVLHRDGNIPLVGEECRVDVTVGKVLNLLSKSGRYAGMRALIQEVEHDIDRGYTNVRVGPPGHLGAERMMDWLRALTYRRVWNNPATQESGEPAEDLTVRLGKAAVRNSNSSWDNKDKLVLKSDLVNGFVEIDAGLCGDSELKVREVAVGEKQTDGTCKTRYMRIVGSELYDK